MKRMSHLAAFALMYGSFIQQTVLRNEPPKGKGYPPDTKVKRTFKVHGQEIAAESMKDAKRIYHRKFEKK